MTTLAIQGAIGSASDKPVTSLSYAFNSMVNCGEFQFGTNSDGIFLLNSGEQDNGSDYTREITFNTTDLGIKNKKRVRYAYLGIDTSADVTISVKFDEQSWREYSVVTHKSGLQVVRVPIGRDGFGRYVTFNIYSTGRFTVDELSAKFILRNIGTRGY